MAHPLVVQLLLILSGFRVLAASCCNCGVHQSESRCGMLFFYKLGLVAADGGTAEYPKAFLATGQQVGRALFLFRNIDRAQLRCSTYLYTT